MKWFMDCFAPPGDPMLGDQFPVNSYSSMSLDRILDNAKIILETNRDSGIRRVEIGPTTKGMNPRNLDEEA